MKAQCGFHSGLSLLVFKHCKFSGYKPMPWPCVGLCSSAMRQGPQGDGGTSDGVQGPSWNTTCWNLCPKVWMRSQLLTSQWFSSGSVTGQVLGLAASGCLTETAGLRWLGRLEEKPPGPCWSQFLPCSPLPVVAVSRRGWSLWLGSRAPPAAERMGRKPRGNLAWHWPWLACLSPSQSRLPSSTCRGRVLA